MTTSTGPRPGGRALGSSAKRDTVCAPSALGHVTDPEGCTRQRGTRLGIHLENREPVIGIITHNGVRVFVDLNAGRHVVDVQAQRRAFTAPAASRSHAGVRAILGPGSMGRGAEGV